MNHLQFEISQQHEGQKLMDYLIGVEQLSRRFCKTASKNQRLRVNGKIVHLGEVLHSKDVILIPMASDESQNIEPEPLLLDIVYEDEDIIIVNKSAFMLVHPTKNHIGGTLANGLIYHFRENKESCIVRFVSRLDRDTSGLILIAKNAFAHMQLAKSMEAGQIEKVYQGIIYGHLSELENRIELPIGKAHETEIKRCVQDGGQASITHYRTLQRYDFGSLLELQLETGRTHQIRVHLSFLGHPLMGDELYGNEMPVVEQDTDADDYRVASIMNRQALHATYLEFPHPRSGEKMAFNSEIPPDMLQQLGELGTLWEN